MTTAQTAQLLGKTATIYLGGLSIDVIITDVKSTYGKTRYQVTPIAGLGAIWVETIILEDAGA